VLDGCWAQVWSAVQAPVLPQGPLGAQPWCGSAAPAPTKVQVPAVPGRLHAWQSGQAGEAVSQQTPSTQRPAAHCASMLQPAPIPPALWQCPAPSQNAPAAQSAAFAQAVLHPDVVHA
jgi:hypothetical protein